MRQMTALAIAVAIVWLVTVTVMAVWPAIGDAPWEDGNGESLGMLRCEDALERRLAAEEALARPLTYEAFQAPLRSLAESNPWGPVGYKGEVRALEEIIADAERDIDRYCR